MSEHEKAEQARKGLIDSIKGKAKEFVGAVTGNAYQFTGRVTLHEPVVEISARPGRRRPGAHCAKRR